MRIQVRDEGFLQTIRPLDVAGYLSAKGWRLNHAKPGLAQYWTKNDDYEVLLPLNRRLDDFAIRIADLLVTLERAEHRNQPDIIADVREGTADSIRIGVEGEDVADGTIGVSDASSLVSTGRHLVWASACSATRPRAFYARRRPPEANEYLKKVRLAQTESGSFKVRLLSPVTPLPQGPDGVMPVDPHVRTGPFERRAVEMLSTGLHAAENAADELFSGTDSAHIESLVAAGLSANLCDALGEMSTVLGNQAILSISIAWSWRRPQTQMLSRSFSFSSDRIDAIKEAGRVLKEFSPREEFELLGTVVRLERGETDFRGRAVVRTYFDGGYKLVAVTLTEDPYSVATRAHEGRALVSCFGDLVRDGRSYALENARAFRIVAIDD